MLHDNLPTDFDESKAPVEEYVLKQVSHEVNGTSKNCICGALIVLDDILPQPTTKALRPTNKSLRFGLRQTGWQATAIKF